MSREGSFGFTHLVEDDDADDVACIGESHLDLELQPHLSTHNRNKYITTSGFEVSGHQADQQGTGWQQSFIQGFGKPETHKANGERPKEGSPIVETVTDNGSAAYTKTFNKVSLEHSEHDIGISNPHTNGVINTAQEQPMVHIQYSATQGKVNVMQGQVVTRSDGSRYIETQGIPQHWSELERPLHQSKIKFLKIFSILACISFFPFGIPAVYFAFRTETEFNEGIMKGNIDRAQKFAKRTERLIVISFIMLLVLVALVVTVLVRTHNSSVPRGLVMG